MGNESDAGLPESRIEFSEFILSLATNAVVHLGGGEDAAETVDAAIDLSQAAQYIDILVMLKDKTRGNLVQAEEALLDSVLYDLRMKYLEVLRAQQRGT